MSRNYIRIQNIQMRRRETSTAKKWENPACTELGFITRDEKSKRVGRGAGQKGEGKGWEINAKYR